MSICASERSGTVMAESSLEMNRDDSRLRRGGSKVERYKWSLRDQRGRYQSIHKSQLFVDKVYQRDHKDAKVREIASDWSWMACGAILVARRSDGQFCVIDGQHRVLAAQKRTDIDTLDCIVFDVCDVKDEATGFLGANTLRKPVSAIGKFKAMRVAGDSRAIEVHSVLETIGLQIANKATPHGFCAIAWAIMAAGADAHAFRLTMRTARELCGDTSAIREQLCRGLFSLQRKHKALEDAKFLRRLLSVGIVAVEEGMHSACVYYKKTGDGSFYKGILDSVNRGLRNRFYVVNEESAG